MPLMDHALFRSRTPGVIALRFRDFRARRVHRRRSPRIGADVAVALRHPDCRGRRPAQHRPWIAVARMDTICPFTTWMCSANGMTPKTVSMFTSATLCSPSTTSRMTSMLFMIRAKSSSPFPNDAAPRGPASCGNRSVPLLIAADLEEESAMTTACRMDTWHLNGWITSESLSTILPGQSISFENLVSTSKGRARSKASGPDGSLDWAISVSRWP